MFANRKLFNQRFQNHRKVAFYNFLCQVNSKIIVSQFDSWPALMFLNSIPLVFRAWHFESAYHFYFTICCFYCELCWNKIICLKWISEFCAEVEQDQFNWLKVDTNFIKKVSENRVLHILLFGVSVSKLQVGNVKT